MTDTIDVARVRALNDALRRSGNGGKLVMTRGVAALDESRQRRALDEIAAFDKFDVDNDPHGEHDFGSLVVDGEHLFFKIDYYDRTLTKHSPDQADPAVTCRVLTVMLAEEY